MNKSFLWKRQKLFLTSFVALPLVLSLTLTGCENLQKKFRRQKKKTDLEDSKFIPVLQPEEYSSRENSMEESYRFHYSLLKVWYKDIYAAIDGKFSDKRQRSTLNEIIKQVDIMQSKLNDEKGIVLSGLKNRLQTLDPLYDEPTQLRNYSRIVSELHQVEKVLRHQFKPDELKESFRSAASKP